MNKNILEVRKVMQRRIRLSLTFVAIREEIMQTTIVIIHLILNKNIMEVIKDMQRRICLSLTFVARREEIMHTTIVIIHLILWIVQPFCSTVLEEAIYHQNSQGFQE